LKQENYPATISRRIFVGKTVSIGSAGTIRAHQALSKVEAGGATGSVNPSMVFLGWN